MHYAISTNAYARFPLTEAIERIHHCGYSALEIVADYPHFHPLRITAEEIHQIRRLLEQKEMSVSSINANTAMSTFPMVQYMTETVFEPSLCNPSEEIRLQRIKYTEKCIDLAVQWGADCISVTSGKCLAGNPPEQAYLIFIESLTQLLNYAERRNIRIGIEYEPGLLIENAREAKRLLDECNHPLLGINLDLGHAEVAGESLGETIRLLEGKIHHIHLEDIKGRKHYHLVPGEGDIDFLEVLRALQFISYDRFIAFEIYTYPDDPDSAARRALAHMSNYMIKEK